MNRQVSTLLAGANAALAATTRLRGANARVAAWYARAALEEIVIGLLGRHNLSSDPAAMSMASRLICLRVLDAETADNASYAWWALSRACHQHAYELTPTNSEIQHLVTEVTALSESLLV